MSLLWVYALVDPAPSALGAGLGGEPLQVIHAGGLSVVVGELVAAPPVDEQALQGHDAAVRRLCSVCAAVLPVRFGAGMADTAELTRALAPQRGALAQALDLVRGCEQMTLRVFGRLATTPKAEPRGGGRGARYLRQRARARELPQLAPLREALARWIRAERVEPASAPPLLGSVYHLIERGRAQEYAAAVHTAAAALPVRVTLSGPWPAYAFAPEVAS